ncbi:flagellar motor switch protein FliN [Oceanococcus atlanticus]|uniref:Flagellar motor switch protein FliN n=1 Tax=Oceanococcus atlanticus TaxID=1317117 RepID=A0A1Y1SG29_9GAMM|nr:flagellar motor switch protein FliN [Oceanococcus atlanticus]ORE88622.1 flagellar motor switch protein FliN [Oceanococcus atlanticus]
MSDSNEQAEAQMSPEELAQVQAMQAASDTPQPAQDMEGYTPPSFAQSEEGESEVNLDLILDVPITLSMEVGHAKVPIRNLLQLNQGSVVELDRVAGEPLDVFVNGTLIAHGEVVVVNDKFGVRLLDVVSPAERIRKLK